MFNDLTTDDLHQSYGFSTIHNERVQPIVEYNPSFVGGLPIQTIRTYAPDPLYSQPKEKL